MPATDIAADAGIAQAGSMVALGAFVAATNIVRLASLLAVAEEVLPPYRRQFAKANREALRLGYAAVEQAVCEAWSVGEPVQ